MHIALKKITVNCIFVILIAPIQIAFAQDVCEKHPGLCRKNENISTGPEAYCKKFPSHCGPDKNTALGYMGAGVKSLVKHESEERSVDGAYVLRKSSDKE